MGKPEIPASSDPSFRGNNTRYNPEEMLVASLSSCHMLWYLHVCSEAGVAVTAYSDHATGIMEEEGNAGAFVSVTLHPVVTVLKKEMIEKATALHDEAHALCYIARSVNFEVHHSPVCRSGQE
jgi:organic hydroperoxide reductase OsmC/OhrA